MPHANGWREANVVAEAFKFNAPILFTPGQANPRSFASIDTPNVVIDTIKQAEDGKGIIVRLYECHGSRGVAKLTVDTPFKSATLCNVLEQPLAKAKVKANQIEIAYAPYQIISLRIN